MSVQQRDFADLMIEGIKEVLTKFAEQKYEDLKKDFIARFDAEKGAYISGLVIKMMRTVDLNIMQDRLIITIREEN